MWTMIFLLTTIVLFGVVVALVAILAESKGTTFGVLERWRDMFARRAEWERTKQELQHVATQLDVARGGAQPIVDRIVMEKHRELCEEIGPKNHHQSVHQFGEFLDFLAARGFGVSPDRRRALFAELELAFERASRLAEQKARQAELKAQMREEERVQREAERAIREAEQETTRKQKALEDAIRLLGDAHSEQVERLRRELAEAQAKSERAKSMAQQTKAGNVYVISNVGSFGRGVFKVGMTRRLDPQERIDELGDASVPFDFDVHALIASPDAPGLEASLHQELADYRVNKVNLRKEFFRVDLDVIVRSVKKHHGVVEFQADAAALEYFESLEIEKERRGELATIDDVEAGQAQQAGGEPLAAESVVYGETASSAPAVAGPPKRDARWA